MKAYNYGNKIRHDNVKRALGLHFHVPKSSIRFHAKRRIAEELTEIEKQRQDEWDDFDFEIMEDRVIYEIMLGLTRT